MSDNENKRNPAIQAKKNKVFEVDKPFVSSRGVTIKFVNIASMVIQDAQKRVPVPEPPEVWLEDKERFMKNSNDPYYLEQLKELPQLRAAAGVDALIESGILLVDDLPEDRGWLNSLKRQGIIKHPDLLKPGEYAYDLDDPDDLKFLYKKYVAVGNAELEGLARLAGVKEEDVQEQFNSFQD